jgi:hypothetical protein
MVVATVRRVLSGHPIAGQSRHTTAMVKTWLSRGRAQDETAESATPEGRTGLVPPAVLRITAHIAVWTPFIYGAASSIQGGWRPIADDASIALRSWDVLARYGPLVGQASKLARGAYGLGPLQYWLLAVPVHLDPGHGALWGAALWCMLAGSLAIEAAWSVARGLGALIAALTVLAVVLWIPEVTTEPLWNPWFGMMFFVAAFAAAWAVMCGHRWWWPVLVITASIAAQAHLVYALPSAAIVLVAFVIGLADTVRGHASYWWTLAGIAALAGCWTAPLVQQFTGHPGNLSTIFGSGRTTGPQGGLSFGLKAIAASVRVPPVSSMRLISLPGIYPVAKYSVAAGAAVVVLMAVIAVAAARYLRSRRTVMLAIVSLVACVATAFTFADFPLSSINQKTTKYHSLNYLMTPMLMVGVLTWLAAGTFLVLIGRRVTAAARARAAARETQDGEPALAARRPAAHWAVAASALGVAAVVGLTAWASTGVLGSRRNLAGTPYLVSLASRRIEARLPHRQSFSLAVVIYDKHIRRHVTFGLVYALSSAGYLPEVADKYAWQLGTAYERSGHSLRKVTVYVRPSSVSVSVTPRGRRHVTGRGSHGSQA